MSALLIAYLYLQAKSTKLNISAGLADNILCIGSFERFFFSSFFLNDYILYDNYSVVLHIILPNLQLIFFVICSVVKSFKKVLICRLIMGSIVVYRTNIISNILNKLAYNIERKIIKNWLI